MSLSLLYTHTHTPAQVEAHVQTCLGWTRERARAETGKLLQEQLQGLIVCGNVSWIMKAGGSRNGGNCVNMLHLCSSAYGKQHIVL